MANQSEIEIKRIKKYCFKWQNRASRKNVKRNITLHPYQNEGEYDN
jgi:hypothetical protein